jgi:hypothetical protein
MFNWKNSLVAFVAVFAASFILISCGEGGSSTLGTHSSSILSDVDSTAVPEGVNPTLFNQLRNELKRQLTERIDGSDRLVATAPVGTAGYVSDLAYTEGTNELTWTYMNVGDYDQNGEVGVPDITPIAVHFGHTLGPISGWPDLADAYIDGDASGEVGVSDITPIAQNYLNTVVLYDILTSDTENGTYTMIGSVSFPYPNTPPVRFTELLPAGNLGWVRVQPLDGTGGPGGAGELSNPVQIAVTNEPPVARFDYTQQETGFIVDFDAIDSTDNDGTIVNYEWDWDNDGTYDFNTTTPNTTHDYGSQITTECTLRVTDDDGDSSTITKWVYVLELAVDWIVVPVLGEGEGMRPSFAYIGDDITGKPGIAYYANFNSAYIAATDVYGASWGTPTVVETYIPNLLSLADIDGNPAIAYNDYSDNDLKYVRATDATGMTWGTIIDVDTTVEAGKSYIDMHEVNGNPAIAYYVGDTGTSNYIRSNDSTGDTWGTSIVIHPFPPSSTYLSLAVVGGVPAIGLTNNSPVKPQFIRGDDADGTGWSAPLDVFTDNSIWGWTSLVELQTVPVTPAIACSGDGPNSVLFISATDTAGTTWQDPILLEDDTNKTFGEVSMAIVDGYPCVAYVEYNQVSLEKALVFRQGLNPSGTAWSAPIYVALSTAAEDVKLLDVRGRPAIGYYLQGGGGGIRYAYSPAT